MNALAHLKTVACHRQLVRKYCFRLGLYRQGLVHDLSKYSPAEFIQGARYYQGTDSPNFRERRENGLGYSLAWLHHKGRNRHHFDYWLDYCLQPDGSFVFSGCRMPIRYVAEMFCDSVAASRTYLKENYSDASPYDYFMRSRKKVPMHPDTREEIEKMLLVLKEEGEEAAFAYVKKRLQDEKRSVKARRG